jgi:signal transduction histidine kinase
MLAGIMHRTSNKILDQLNELVDWAKKQREKTNFNPEKLQLYKGIDESLELLKANATQKSIKLENEIPRNVYVNADSLMLRSILQNIVTNAIKFTPQSGGSVKVTAQTMDSMVEICVQDSGVGMSKEIQDKILGNSNLSSPGTDSELGTGLGISLIKDFVSQHGGSIMIDSQPGKGTCFKFTVPVN